MARTKNDLAVIEQPAVNDGAVRTDLITFDQLNEHRSAAIAADSEEFGIHLPAFDIDLYFNNINFLAEQAAEILMTQGVWLIALKEALPHGQFQEELTKRSRMSVRSAQILMTATRRLSTEGGKTFLANAKRDSHLSRTRLIELAINMPEHDLATLAENGGEVDGYTREEYLSMSRADLMAVLRDRDDTINEGERQLKSETTKRKAAESKAKREASGDPPGARVKQFEADVLTASFDAAKLMRKDLVDIVEALHAEKTGEPDGLELTGPLEDSVNTAIRQAFERTVTALKETAAHLGIDPQSVGLAGEEFMPADYS